MLKCVDRYIGMTVVKGILLAWAVLLVLFLVLGLVGELRDGQGEYGVLEALWFIVLTAPTHAYQAFPLAALIGALMGVGGLAADFELVAFRAAGVSRLRLALAALFGTLLVLLPVLVVGEYVAPQAEQQARAFRLAKQAGRIHLGGAGGLWIRDGDNFINIRRPLMSADGAQQSVRFEEVVMYRLNPSLGLNGIIRADQAVPDEAGWELQQVDDIEIAADEIKQTGHASRSWNTKVDPGLLDSAVTRPRYLSMRALGNYVRYLTDNNQDATQYASALWQKIAYPFSVLALVLAGMPFVFGSNRHINLGFQLFIGMMLGTVYVIFSRSLQNFGDAYGLAPPLSAALPVVLLSGIAVWALRRTP